MVTKARFAPTRSGMLQLGDSCPLPLEWVLCGCLVNEASTWFCMPASKSKAGGQEGPPPLSGSRINPQHFYQVGDFAEMVQGVAGRFVVSTQKVGVEHILPRPTAPGTRLDLGQADVAQCEYSQSLEQGAGDILDAKGNRGFVGAGQNAPGSTDQEEASKVTLVVFHARR